MPKPSTARMRKCHDGKVRFEKREDAAAAMNQMLARKARGGSPIVSVLRVYGCACGGFHFGRARGLINWDLVASYTPPAPKSKGKAHRAAT